VAVLLSEPAARRGKGAGSYDLKKMKAAVEAEGGWFMLFGSEAIIDARQRFRRTVRVRLSELPGEAVSKPTGHWLMTTTSECLSNIRFRWHLH